MLKVIFDHDFDHDVLRGLKLLLPDFDYTTAQLEGLDRLHDLKLLVWAAKAGCHLITHDENSMPTYFGQLLTKGETLTGTFVVPRRIPIRQMIDELYILITSSEPSDWTNILKILPL